jgi:hypothetical protein
MYRYPMGSNSNFFYGFNFPNQFLSDCYDSHFGSGDKSNPFKDSFRTSEQKEDPAKRTEPPKQKKSFPAGPSPFPVMPGAAAG